MSKNEKLLWAAVAALTLWNFAETAYASFWLSALRAYLVTHFGAKF